MKRSHVLLLIQKKLTTGNKDIEQLSVELLNLIEQIGMLPPESSKSLNLCCYDLEHTRYAHVWDEEELNND